MGKATGHITASYAAKGCAHSCEATIMMESNGKANSRGQDTNEERRHVSYSIASFYTHQLLVTNMLLPWPMEKHPDIAA